MSSAGFRKMLARTGEGSEFPFPVHPHMLRHAAMYKLANETDLASGNGDGSCLYGDKGSIQRIRGLLVAVPC